MLPKFNGIEDAYIFMRKFEEVCATMQLQQLTEDAVKLRLINFALKDSAKKRLYSLPNQSIASWEGLVRVFLKNFFRTIRLPNLGMKLISFINYPMSLFGSTLIVLRIF